MAAREPRRDDRGSDRGSPRSRGSADRARRGSAGSEKPARGRPQGARTGGRSAPYSRGQRRAPAGSGERTPRTAEQTTYDGPPLDESTTGKELDRAVLAQLRSLPERLALRVARHLVAAGRLLDEDPQTAYQHTLAARARAARVAVVREACGEAAYAAGEYAEALAELRAARRMNGVADYLPVMADCERALGRPERALRLAKDPAVATLSEALRVEMIIVEAGARADQGDHAAALGTLESAPLRSKSRAPWVARLRYAYADLLLLCGRREEAVQWFHRTVAVDGDGLTDADERLAQLESSG